MAKILIVDDDENFRSVFRDMLKEFGYEVCEATDGSVAKDLISTSKFDLVISDYQMPQLNGMELLSWVRKVYDRSFRSHQPMPFILMTAFSHGFHVKEAHNLGASDFLLKPLDIKEVRECINKYLKPAVDPMQAELDKSANDVQTGLLAEEYAYCRIPVERFISNEALKIAIYVRVSDKKYIRIAHKGSVLPRDRFEHYKKKKLKYFYVKKEEFPQLVDFNLSVTKVISKSGLPSEKKMGFLEYTGETVLENVFVNGVNHEAFDEAKSFVKLSVEMLSKSNNVFQLLDILNAHNSWLYAHSIGVSAYSAMIANQMGWHSSQTHFKLIVAGLFHDVGKKEIDPNILNKKRALMTREERSVIESHVTRGKEILQSLPEIPGDVIQIVYQHHEDCLGQGYPRRMAKEKIHPLAKIVATANIFCRYAVKNPDSDGCDARQAIEYMDQFWAENLDADCFAALKRICLAEG